MATAPVTHDRPTSEAFGAAREAVQQLLTSSKAFNELDPQTRREIANHTLALVTYLADPEGINTERNQKVRAAQALAGQDPTGAATTPQFRAQAAREGAAVAGAYLQAVNFPNFVAGLISGVFHSIVQSSIQQMEAYGRLVADVAKTLNQFRDENVTVNQGRDHLVERYPEIFELSVDQGDDGSPQPKVRMRDGADETAALQRVQQSLPLDKPVSSLDDETVESQLVPAARTAIASNRQQLLATMVLLGINRIIVKDGRIAAKVMFDFKAGDKFRGKTRAESFDYAPGMWKSTSTGQYEYGKGSSDSSSSDGSGDGSGDNRDGSYYSKGQYRNTIEPVLTLQSVTTTSVEADLQTRANLSGQVEVNFASDFLPLEKIADSGQLFMIQQAAQPGRKAAPGAGGASTPAATSPAATPPATAQPAAPAAGAR